MNSTSVALIPQHVIDQAINEASHHFRKMAKIAVITQPEIDFLSTDEMKEEYSKIIDAGMIKLETDLRVDCGNLAKKEILEACKIVLEMREVSKQRISALMAEFAKQRTRVEQKVTKFQAGTRMSHQTRLDAVGKKYEEDVIQLIERHQNETIKIFFSNLGLTEETLAAIRISITLA